MNEKKYDKIITARKCFDEFNEMKILNDVFWDTKNKKYCLKFSINLCLSNENKINNTTNWYMAICLKDIYPLIKIYPAIDGGISDTFPHQMNNGTLNENDLWRNGEICLEYDLDKVSGLTSVPTDLYSMIKWYLQRLIIWINAASNNALMNIDDRFEMPDFPQKLANSDINVAFTEDTTSYMQWESREDTDGTCEVKTIDNYSAISCFMDVNNQEIITASWGDYVSKNSNLTSKEIWILLDNIPIINHFQAPITFGELNKILNKENKNLFLILDKYVRYIKKNKIKFLMLGFPIPYNWKREGKIIHWQAILLPRIKKFNGFRNNNNSYWTRIKKQYFREDSEINWLNSENWSTTSISERGRLDCLLAEKKVLLIGAGSIGSTLAELLIRSSLSHLTIVDNDILVAGNLSRHVLSLEDIRRSKVDGLVKRLISINPNASVRGVNEYFNINTSVEKYNLIVDCTGSSDLLESISQQTFNSNKIVLSVSTSLEAKNIYLSYWKNCKISLVHFNNLTKSYIEIDSEKYLNLNLPRNGIGCWHPTFPARVDDIWIIASMALKFLEELSKNNIEGNVVHIYQKTSIENWIFKPYKLVELYNE